ncbi:acyltransferase [Microbacterium sorbitolivorans]|uniref:acyltransferase family protein n=1 Tax=Microbacterium sorbitolivorans TaxID=1867410 RepID=UPI0013B0691E|nr:acyltransferase family protein [Microbacterium sorbitolivorans]GGF43465.1 acyltransferase [Microbacterium sorbitolivorans]
MSAKTKQRLDIQGLRAVAVVAVIAAHVTGVPQGGFVGVDIFFVISGFLITGLLLRETARTGTISFRKFYERRAKRILPAAVIVLAATIAASFALLGKTGGKGVAVDALYSAFFAGNWRFAIEGVDYFAEGTPPSPLQHFWSLGVEEQFYLVWPWVMLGIVAIAARSGWRAQRARRLTRTLIVALSLVSFVWALIETQTNPTFAYFSTFSRAWELGIGAILAFLPGLSLSLLVRRILAWAGLAGIALSIVVISESSSLWPAPLALLPVLSTALVIVAGIYASEDEAAYGPWILTNRVATYLGDISYSLYLWHFPIAILGVTLLPAGSKRYYLAAIVLTLALSIASFHLVENPARRATWFRWSGGRIRGITRAWMPVGVALVAVCALGAAGIAGTATLRGEAAPGPTAQVVADPTATPADPENVDPAACWGAGSMLYPEACADVDLGAIQPAADAVLSDTGGAYECYNAEDAPVNSCTYGSDDAGLKVALVGDSHAAALLPALWPQLDALGWSVDTYLGRGCALVDHVDGATDCDQARPDINAALTSGDYDIVLTTSTRKFALDADDQKAILTQIRDAGSEVIVVRDNPLPTDEAVACANRIAATAADKCGTDESVALENPHSLADAADDLGMPVVDLTDLYCADGSCPAIIGNTRVYRDSAGHTTATWATTISKTLGEALRDAMPAER